MVNTAGSTSEGSKAWLERRALGIRSGPASGTAIVHGTCSTAPFRIFTRSTPRSAAGARGRSGTVAETAICTDAPGRNLAARGMMSTAMSAASAVPGSIVTSSGRRLTFRNVTNRPTSAFSANATPRPTVGGSATSSTAAAPDGSTVPAAAPPARRDDATSACFRPAASRSGRAWASRAAAPAVSAAAALEPLIVPYRAAPSSFRPGSAVASPMPAALTSGFWPPSKASPSDENGAASPRPAFASNAAAPTARVTGI